MKPKPKLNKYEELCKINETGSPAPTIATVKGSTSTKKVKFVPQTADDVIGEISEEEEEQEEEAKEEITLQPSLIL